ncbi:MAG: hypothetical protein ACREDY_26005 [Bradyrhizobium sp.]
MADRIYTSGGGSGMGILGVIVGALLVIGAIVFFVGGFNGGAKTGGGPSVTINAPSAPHLPSPTNGSR